MPAMSSVLVLLAPTACLEDVLGRLTFNYRLAQIQLLVLVVVESYLLNLKGVRTLPVVWHWQA